MSTCFLRQVVLVLWLCLVLPAVAFTQQRIAWKGKAARQWANVLDDNHPRVPWYAANALGQPRPAAAEAVEPLVAVLGQRVRNEYVCGNAAWAIERIGTARGPVLDVLIDAMSTNVHLSVRRNCPQALSNLVAAATTAIVRRGFLNTNS